MANFVDDFIGKAPALEPQKALRTWELYTNGTSNKKGVGIVPSNYYYMLETLTVYMDISFYI